MLSEFPLDVLFWSSLLLSIPLFIISLMAVGKHVADLQYQVAANLNGIRWIQSWINLRTHANRVAFAFAFTLTSVLGIFDVEYITRSWIGRVVFLIVLVAFLLSAILDWFAENRQLKILMQYSKVNNVTSVRVYLHKLRSSLQILYGVAELPDDTPNREKLVTDAQYNVSVLLDLIQRDVRAMDPSYSAKEPVQEIYFGDERDASTTE